MTKEAAIKLCESKQVRSIWDGGKGKWYFSIVDVIVILTDSPRPRKYWNALKTKLASEGSELSQKMGQLKMKSADGKYYLAAVADGGTVAGNARVDLERKSGKRVVTQENFKEITEAAKRKIGNSTVE